MDNSSYISRTSGLRAKDYIGYAMVDTAGCLCFSLVTALLQKFYTDVFNISPLFIMFMFIGARVWDAINDPIMGRISDIVPTGKRGRYRRWFLFAAAPLAVSTVLMFVKWPGLGGDVNYTATCIYATVTYVLFGMCYTVLQIPYGSLASVVTTDISERSKLSSFRGIGAALGSVPVFVITSFCYAKRVDSAGNFVIGENGKVITDMQYRPVIIGVIIMAAVSMLMLFIAYKLNRERVVTKPAEKKKGDTLAAAKGIITNRAFMSLSLVSMLLLAGQMFTQSFYLYVFNDYFNANWMNLASQACTYAPMLLFMPVMPKMAAKLGKKEISAYGMAIAAGANLVLFFLRGLDPSVLKIAFLALCFVSGLGLNMIVMQQWAMVTDAIDEIEIKTGRRDDGTAFSIFAFFRKLGQVLAAVCVNTALLSMNYNYAKGAVQTLDNLKKMYDLSTLIPAVMFGIMAILLFAAYPLSNSSVASLQEKKEKRLKEAYENNTIDIG